MKSKKHLYEPHLTIKEFTILPGEEWLPRSPGWSLLQIKNGSGYYLQAQKNWELAVGTLLVFTGQTEGSVRASQLSGMSLSVFNIIPSRLTGLITLGEHDLFKAAALRRGATLKIISADNPLAVAMNGLTADKKSDGLSFRLKLLQLFIEAVGTELETTASPNELVDAKERLRLLLKETPPDQLVEMSFQELSRLTHCTPRHLSRIFQELVGMTFRDKRMEIRMARASELLATSQSKVVEVALESGFKSLSLFNLIFNRRFGTSPGRWRRRHLKNGGEENGLPKKSRTASLEINFLSAKPGYKFNHEARV